MGTSQSLNSEENFLNVQAEMAPVEVDHIPAGIESPVKFFKVVDKAMSLPLVSSAYTGVSKITYPYVESTMNNEPDGGEHLGQGDPSHGDCQVQDGGVCSPSHPIQSVRDCPECPHSYCGQGDRCYGQG